MAKGNNAKPKKQRKPGKFCTRKFLSQEKFELYRFYRKYVIYRINNISKNIVKKKDNYCWLCPKDCKCAWKSTSKFSFFSHVRKLEKQMHRQLIFEIGERKKKPRRQNNLEAKENKQPVARNSENFNVDLEQFSKQISMSSVDLNQPLLATQQNAPNRSESIESIKTVLERELNEVEMANAQALHEKENLYPLDEESFQLMIDPNLIFHSPEYRYNRSVDEGAQAMVESIDREMSQSIDGQKMIYDQKMDQKMTICDDHSYSANNSSEDQSMNAENAFAKYEENSEELLRNSFEQHFREKKSEKIKQKNLFDIVFEQHEKKIERNSFELNDCNMFESSSVGSVEHHEDESELPAGHCGYMSDDESEDSDPVAGELNVASPFGQNSTTQMLGALIESGDQPMDGNFDQYTNDSASIVTMMECQHENLLKPAVSKSAILPMNRSKSLFEDVPIFTWSSTMFNLFNRLLSHPFK